MNIWIVVRTTTFPFSETEPRREIRIASGVTGQEVMEKSGAPKGSASQTSGSWHATDENITWEASPIDGDYISWE